VWSGLVALAVVVLIERSWAEHRRPMTNAEILTADSATRTFHPTRAEEGDLAMARARGMSDWNQGPRPSARAAALTRNRFAIASAPDRADDRIEGTEGRSDA